MLPDFRFIIGATLATALLAMAGLGLFTATRLAHHAKVGPLEASRSLAYTDPFETRYTDLETARRFDALARRAGATETAANQESTPTALVPPSSATPDETMAAPEGAGTESAAVAPLVPSEQARAVAIPLPVNRPPVMAYEPDHQEHEQAAPSEAAISNASTELSAPATTPAEAIAAAPVVTPEAAVAPAAMAHPDDEQGSTGTLKAELERTPAPAERLAAAPPPAAAEPETAAPAPTQPVTPAASTPAALPNAAVTVHPARKTAAPVTHTIAAAGPPRTRVRSEPQQQQQQQHRQAYQQQRLTGFEWAGYYAKPQPVEQTYQPAPMRQQQYVAQPYAVQQYRAQPYREPQYARDPYTNQQWRPWSELGR